MKRQTYGQAFEQEYNQTGNGMAAHGNAISLLLSLPVYVIYGLLWVVFWPLKKIVKLSWGALKRLALK